MANSANTKAETKETKAPETKNPETNRAKVPMKKKVKDWWDAHPKTQKWVKRIGVGLGWAASVGIAWMAGEQKGMAERSSTTAEVVEDDGDDDTCDMMEDNGN